MQQRDKNVVFKRKEENFKMMQRNLLLKSSKNAENMTSYSLTFKKE